MSLESHNSNRNNGNNGNRNKNSNNSNDFKNSNDKNTSHDNNNPWGRSVSGPSITTINPCGDHLWLGNHAG